jgi:hypothetical protein
MSFPVLRSFDESLDGRRIKPRQEVDGLAVYAKTFIPQRLPKYGGGRPGAGPKMEQHSDGAKAGAGVVVLSHHSGQGNDYRVRGTWDKAGVWGQFTQGKNGCDADPAVGVVQGSEQRLASRPATRSQRLQRRGGRQPHGWLFVPKCPVKDRNRRILFLLNSSQGRSCVNTNINVGVLQCATELGCCSSCHGA